MESFPEPNPVKKLTIAEYLQIAVTVCFRLPWTVLTTLLRRWVTWSTYHPPPLREHVFRHVMTWCVSIKPILNCVFCVIQCSYGVNFLVAWEITHPDRSGTTLPIEPARTYSPRTGTGISNARSTRAYVEQTSAASGFVVDCQQKRPTPAMRIWCSSTATAVDM